MKWLIELIHTDTNHRRILANSSEDKEGNHHHCDTQFGSYDISDELQ